MSRPFFVKMTRFRKEKYSGRDLPGHRAMEGKRATRTCKNNTRSSSNKWVIRNYETHTGFWRILYGSNNYYNNVSPTAI
jgi:hypothetical protein